MRKQCSLLRSGIARWLGSRASLQVTSHTGRTKSALSFSNGMLMAKKLRQTNVSVDWVDTWKHAITSYSNAHFTCGQSLSSANRLWAPIARSTTIGSWTHGITGASVPGGPVI